MYNYSHVPTHIHKRTVSCTDKLTVESWDNTNSKKLKSLFTGLRGFSRCGWGTLRSVCGDTFQTDLRRVPFRRVPFPSPMVGFSRFTCRQGSGTVFGSDLKSFFGRLSNDNETPTVNNSWAIPHSQKVSVDVKTLFPDLNLIFLRSSIKIKFSCSTTWIHRFLKCLGK